MKYTKQDTTQGAWVDKKELISGTKAKIVSETEPVEKVYEGKPQTQNVTKIRIDGYDEAKNVNVNKATINALIDAFGEDSKDWMNKELTIQTEKMVVGGKRVTALYLVPEGFEMKEDDGGYIVIERIGNQDIPIVEDDPQ